MKKKLIFIGAVFLLCTGCKFGLQEIFWRADPVDRRSKELVKLTGSELSFDIDTMPSKYDCLLITDVHFGNDHYSVRQDAFFKSLQKYKAEHSSPSEPQILFCIALGDIADHGRADEFDDYEAFQKGIAAVIGKPNSVYNVVGNHDLYNSGWKLWEKSCYPHRSAYYFETKTFGWYFVDTGNGTLGRPQFYDLKAKLQSSSKPKFIFTHYPLYGHAIQYFSLSNPRERAELISLCAKNNVKMYCAGHYHRGAYYNYGRFKEFTLKALGSFGEYHILHIDEDAQTFSVETVPF